MRKFFNIVANPDGESCTILLYGVIGESAHEVNAAGVISQIMEAEKTYRRIGVRINSVGGEVGTGIAIFNALRASKAEVTIYIDYLAASTASFIASCGRTVKMSRYGRLMIHKPSGGVWGTSEEIQNYLDELKRIEETICDIYSHRTGKSADEIRQAYMDGQDHWLSAEEAVSLGFADEIYDSLPVPFAESGTMEDRCERFSALYAGTFNSQNNKSMFEKIKKLQPFSDCADEAAILARISEISNKAAAHDTVVAENKALKEKVSAYEAKEKAATEAENKAILDAAVKDGRINETQRADFEKMLSGGQAEQAKSILASLKPFRHAAGVIVDDHKGVQPGSVWAERMEEIRKKNNL